MPQNVLDWIESQNNNKAGSQHTSPQRESGNWTQGVSRQTEICRHFWKDDCVHGLSRKTPGKKRKECRFNHPTLCWGLLKHRHGIDGYQSTKICRRTHPGICKLAGATGKCIRKERDGQCAGRYHLGKHPDGYQRRKTRTQIEKECKEVPEEPAEDPIKQDGSTRKERNVAKKIAT